MNYFVHVVLRTEEKRNADGRNVRNVQINRRQIEISKINLTILVYNTNGIGDLKQ